MIPSTFCNDCGRTQPCSTKRCLEGSGTEGFYLDEEVLRIDAQIHQLIGLRVSLLDSRNHQCSPIYALPVELLSAIFLHFLEKGQGWRTPTSLRQAIILSSVSSHWRETVFRTPKLWDAVGLTVRDDTVETCATLLQHSLQHATNATVEACLILDDGVQITDRALHYRPIEDILFALEYRHKIQALYLQNPPVEWLAGLSQLLEVHTLFLEDLESEDRTPVIVDLRTQPLHGLSLSFTSWPGSISLPPSLQLLRFGDLPTGVKLALLRQCPNLIECQSYLPSSLHPSTGFISTPLSLEHLEILTWSVRDGLQDMTSVQNLHFPALEHLHLFGVHSEQAMPVIAFCHQHSTTLVSLELEDFVSWRVGDIKRLLQHDMPCLELLGLISWPLGRLFEAVWVLTPSNECAEVKFLPRLESLTLSAADCSNPDVDDGGLGEALSQFPSRSGDDTADMINLYLKMLERRRTDQLVPFRLNLPAIRNYDGWKLMWLATLRNRFKQAIQGRCIEVLEDSVPFVLDDVPHQRSV